MAEFRIYLRLEPRDHEQDLQAGFESAVYDPVWFLARQWQMGEFQGENASTPVWANYDLRSRPLLAADSRFDPTEIPAEAIVESEIDDWWTMGRRVRLGREAAAGNNLPDEDNLRFHNPPPPYEHFHGQYDGLALWRAGLMPADLVADLPADAVPAWSNRQLLYQQDESTAFRTEDGTRLVVQRHHGGRMDWQAVDALVGNDAADPQTDSREAVPTALRYPGAPNSRWWQIENAQVDRGSYVPDSAHTATAILTELIFSHSDDWFLFPVTAKSGHVVTMETLCITDGFGRFYDSEKLVDDNERMWPGLQPPEDWALFRTSPLLDGDKGLSAEALVLWHVAEFPLESGPIERVQFGLDEESNLLWAVERVVDGRETASRKTDEPDENEHPKFRTDKPDPEISTMREYVYIPGQGAALFWHPYELQEEEAGGRPRRLEQRRLLDFTREKPWPLPEPQAKVLQAEGEGPHFIIPLAVPSNGIEVERRWQLARDMKGRPVLWIQRRRRPLYAPPARRLRFDVMAEAVEK
ncbi:MAG: hypothetical protein ACK2UJ_22205 [Candidatus Promineifilaceae bacterium]